MTRDDFDRIVEKVTVSTKPWWRIDIDKVPDGDVVVFNIADEIVEAGELLRSHPGYVPVHLTIDEIDELLAMLVRARAAAWPERSQA